MDTVVITLPHTPKRQLGCDTTTWPVGRAELGGLLQSTLQSSRLCKVTEEEVNAPALPSPAREPGAAADGLPEHEVRRALLGLLAEVGTVTATQAAARLDYS